jgi:hypothetical protein
MITALLLTGLLLVQQPLPEITIHATPAAHDLTLKDVISILADYEVKHVDQQPFFQAAYGVTNFDSQPPAVWIFNTGDTPSKRSTVIHELLHIYYHQLGLEASEEFIRQEETRLYLEIFGDGKHQ